MRHAPHDSQSIALATPAALRPLGRMGFFPRGPGPGLIVFAIVLGLFPSIFANVIIFRAGIDAGFYMDGDFIRAQERWLWTVLLVIVVPALIALAYLVHSLRTDASDRGPRIAVTCVLLAALVWNVGIVQILRSALMPIYSYWDVADFAEANTSGDATGLPRADYDGQVLTVTVPYLEGLPEEALAPTNAAPDLCRAFGRFFSAPVEAIRLDLVQGDDTVASINATREACRSWYLQSRVVSRRPHVPPGAR